MSKVENTVPETMPVASQEVVEPESAGMLKTFLDNSGIRFLDNLANFARRDTMMVPTTAVDDNGSLFSDMVTFAISVPALEVHEFGCKELKQYIEDGRISIVALEEAFEKNLPKTFELFQSGNVKTQEAIKVVHTYFLI